MAKEEINGYQLSRMWFDWCFENPDLINPNHSALYFFCIEHCNRLGWKEKFGLPTTMAKEALGIKSYNTYIKTLNDLIDWGFIIMVEKSKNQFSSNIIALSKNNKALNKALDKATVKHVTKHTLKQGESTGESNSSIDKQLTNNQEPLTNNKEQEVIFPFDSKIFLEKWAQWKKYKKDEHRFSYKSKISEQAALKELSELSNANEKLAIQIIDQSISKSWKGFFPIKNVNGTGKQNSESEFDKLNASNAEYFARFAGNS